MINTRISDLLTGEWYIVSSLNSNKVLNIHIGGADPTNVTIWSKVNVDQQKWSIQCDTTNRCFVIRSKKYPNKVLSETNSDGNIIVADYATGSVFSWGTQRWYLHYDNDGRYVIANYLGDYLNPGVVTIENSDITDGNNVKRITNTGLNGQKFYLVRP